MSEFDLAAVIKAAREQKADIVPFSHDGIAVPLLLRPSGNGQVVVESLKAHIDQYRDAPECRTGTATLTDLESFVAHANRFKDVDSAIFVMGAKEAPVFVSVLDYHERVNGITEKEMSEGLPRFGKHRGSYTPCVSAEWAAWQEKDGEELSQGDFATFIEKRAGDIFDIDGRSCTLHELTEWFAKRFARSVAAEEFYGSCQALLDLAEGLEITVTDKVADVSKRGSVGGVRIAFDSESKTSMDVPAAFVIAVPVFEGGDLYQLPVRLKMSVRPYGESKRAVWRLEIYGVERVRKAAIEASVCAVKAGTLLPVFMGSPE